MAITNHERVGKALDLLRDGLRPFAERELKSKHGDRWPTEVKIALSGSALGKSKGDALQDVAVLLTVMDKMWGGVFGATLGKAERNLVVELTDVRNRWAHQEAFSTDDVYRALDSTGRLLTAVSAPQSDEIEKVKGELLRTRYEDQVRGEKRKSAGSAIESAATGSLKSWREVVTPHKDVANGRYQQAEFAADLWQVHLGQGSDEYRDPAEFFRRTYLTESLKGMLVGAVRRLSGKDGDPVVQLQTNFGGGKTHSMLALYHMFSGVAPSDLAGIDVVMTEAGTKALPKTKRVVLVGNKISPGNPVTKADGTVVHTLWGEMAWQLGGKMAYAKIQADDEKATSPGDRLRELFVEYGPCLILIDEWVAYARQLHDQSDLPAGGFETQFSFAQALTESAKLAQNCLLVISLPASDTSGSPHTQADDVEVGGQRGRAALDRLRNVVGRVESSWRPATAEEGFEIVRRRLFEPMTQTEQFRDRDVVVRAFAELYRTQHQEFPPECRDAEYEKRMKAAYPIHPEIFDRLYNDWSTLLKFQRTRGVLRLMAAVIHSLYVKEDKNPLILPANIAIDDPRVQFELTRYLSDNWVPVIEQDVAGPNSLPLRIDSEIPNLNKYAACRRVARTIYLGSAPTATAAHRGLEDRRIKLGCMMPDEPPAIFGDALRRLAGSATYLYQDGAKYWYSTQPTVTKLAEDRAEQLRRDPDTIVVEVEARVRKDLLQRGDFERIHPMPSSSQDVPDDLDARLVVLGVDHLYSKGPDNQAEGEALRILESRGSTPRLYRNTLVFLAADRPRFQELSDAVRKYLAWKQILGDKEELNLDPLQVRQAETQCDTADKVVTSRVPETYQWLLIPTQTKEAQSPIEWESIKLTGAEPLAKRVARKLQAAELLIAGFAGTRLRMELDRIPLWQGEHVKVGKVIEDFAKYLYLPRIAHPSVLVGAIRDGVARMTWESETFAYADGWDDDRKRYRGLVAGAQLDAVDQAGPALLVKPEVARRQLDQENAAKPESVDSPQAPVTGGGTPTPAGTAPEPGGITESTRPRRWHGTVSLDPTRVGRDAARIAEEVIAHLSGIVGATVEVSLEIEARIPGGAPDQVVRTVGENSKTLKFDQHGFERE